MMVDRDWQKIWQNASPKARERVIESISIRWQAIKDHEPYIPRCQQEKVDDLLSACDAAVHLLKRLGRRND